MQIPIKKIHMPVRKLFIALCLLSALSITVVTARAYQIQREFENFKEKVESQQATQDERMATNIQRLNELDRRITIIDQERITERLTRLEALSETTHELLLAIASAIAILMVETAIRLLSNLKFARKEEQGG